MGGLYGQRSSSQLFSTTSSDSRGEIDLRYELSEILRGSMSKPRRGHWVVYRRFDFTTHSDDYDEVFRTAVSGPSYEYTDTLILVRRDPLVAPEAAEAHTPAGLLPGGRFIYYFEYNLNPDIRDQIFEIEWSDNKITPILSHVPHPYVERHNIKEVVPYRLDGGRVEYFSVYTNKDEVNS